MFVRLLQPRSNLASRPMAVLGVTLLAVALLVQGASLSSAAPSTSVAANQNSSAFLTLPFEPSPEMNILSGWYYSGSGGLHNGIDYISGNLKSPKTWTTFPVIASADGEACGNCSGRQGNAVWVKHNIGGVTYYTYYGHLASISPDIPIGSQSRTIKVKRGQFLGMAGNTGSDVIHLHYALYTSSSKPLDPYGIGKLRESYPAPHSGQPGIAWFLSSSQPGDPNTPAQPPASDVSSAPNSGTETAKSDHEDADGPQGGAGGGDSTFHRGYLGVDFDHLAY